MLEILPVGSSLHSPTAPHARRLKSSCPRLDRLLAHSIPAGRTSPLLIEFGVAPSQNAILTEDLRRLTAAQPRGSLRPPSLAFAS